MMSDVASQFANGRLCLRPFDASAVETPLSCGTHELTLPKGWRAQFHIPLNYDGACVAPLLAVFHGVKELDGGLVAAAFAWADRHGALVLAQKSIGISWDLIRGGFGPDVEATNYLLNWILRRHAVDPTHIGIAGFSDGASYALSLGLGNGDLFHDVMAFSPGFMRPGSRIGMPRIFVSHGIADPILPVDCGRRIARQLATEGHDVHYHEFDGGHIVPGKIAETAMHRFLS